MSRAGVKDFYRIQAEQKTKSRSLVVILFCLYGASMGALFLFVNVFVGAIFARPRSFSASNIAGILALALVFALGLAAFQYADARRNGAAFILKRLSAAPPQSQDRYHRQFIDVVEEMRIAAGLNNINSYVIPDPAVNSLALIEADGTPAVTVTEGLLAEFSREELTAAAAHEAAHIARGDTFLLTAIFSLADFFERVSDALSSAGEDKNPKNLAITGIFARLLIRFIGREQEFLADAAAVEIGRDPIGLARAIYKACIGNTFVGDFAQVYAPLFIVAPGVERDDINADWSGPHPPPMERIRRLAAMANVRASDIIRQVWESRKERDLAKRIEPSRDGRPNRFFARPPKFLSKSRRNDCPRCRIPLSETIYEGVPIRSCPKCRGKLVEMETMPRILARREVGFAPELHHKAEEFLQGFFLNPLKTLKNADRQVQAAACPACGYPLKTRPYNYQYFVPVEKCLSCNKIWFDADGLEILQILIEDAKKT